MFFVNKIDSDQNTDQPRPSIGASENFKETHNADYSKLPLELLQQIASYLAAPTEIEKTGGRLCFDADLSMFRTTCQAFARAGKLAILSVMRKSNLMLYLPGTNNTLDDIGKVFIGTEMGQLISKVTITMQPELDFARLDEVMKFCSLLNSSMSANELYEARRFIIGIHIERCFAQRDLLAELKTAKGQDKLAALLQGLPQLKTLGLQCADFIDHEIARAYFNSTNPMQKLDLSSMASHKQLTHCDVFPLLLPYLHHFTELALETDGSIFDRLSAKHIVSQCLRNPLEGPMNSAYRLQKISISLTRQDGMLRGNTDTAYDLQGAAEFGSMLLVAVNLEDLSLRCPVGTMEGYVGESEDRAYRGLGNSSWLTRILQDQHWPKLTSIEIVKFDCNLDCLVSFFRTHRSTMVNAVFRKCEMKSESNILALVEHLRAELNLQICSIGLMPDMDMDDFSGELENVFHKYKQPGDVAFDPDDPWEWNVVMPDEMEDSEEETMAAKVLAHYVLFDKPNWAAYERRTNPDEA